jgi:uncharacterized protein YbjT (DUF2867 family)
MTRILVIGGTGTVGRRVVSQLAATEAIVRVLARNPAAADVPANVDVVHGDLVLPETLDPPLDGIDAVFLVWTAPPVTAGSVIERIAKRARRIVFLSAPLKTPHPLFQQRSAARALGERIESLIEGSGLSWTFLRPGMFAANALRWWAAQIRDGDLVRWPYLSVPTAPIDERDIATVAVKALCDDGHAGAEYVLTGPESLSHFEQISIIGRVLGRTLRAEEIPAEEVRDGRVALPGVPAPAASMLMDAWAAAAGQPAFISTGFQELTGTQPRSFSQWAAGNASLFRP